VHHDAFGSPSSCMVKGRGPSDIFQRLLFLKLRGFRPTKNSKILKSKCPRLFPYAKPLYRVLFMSCEEEDTCMSCEEEDTCMSYEEDTCMSCEEEDVCIYYAKPLYKAFFRKRRRMYASTMQRFINIARSRFIIPAGPRLIELTKPTKLTKRTVLTRPLISPGPCSSCRPSPCLPAPAKKKGQWPSPDLIYAPLYSLLQNELHL
jgi:hypothetical protein